MLMPMLAGLVSRRLTARGAAAGIVAGLIAGVSLFSYKTWWLVGRPDIDPNWLRYDYEALTIFTNVGVTIATMTIVTALETVHPDERRRIADFFVRLTRPKHLDAPTGTGGDEVFSPLPIIAQVTAGTGALLLIAAAVQSSGIGQMINIGAGTHCADDRRRVLLARSHHNPEAGSGCRSTLGPDALADHSRRCPFDPCRPGSGWRHCRPRRSGT